MSRFNKAKIAFFGGGGIFVLSRFAADYLLVVWAFLLSHYVRVSTQPQGIRNQFVTPLEIMGIFLATNVRVWASLMFRVRRFIG